MIYAIANSVSSHLVDKVHHWTGAESLSAIEEDLPLVATKPSRFFDPSNGDLPDVVQLHFRRAPGFERLSQVEYAKLVRDNVTQAEAKAAAERLEKGIRIVGRKAVLRQHWNASPNTREPRRRLSPRVACKNTWARIEALQRNQAFLDLYRAARRPPRGSRGAVPGGHVVALPLRRPEVRREQRHGPAELSKTGFRRCAAASPGTSSAREPQT